MAELIPIFLFLCMAGVLILRPVSKKLGLLIEALAKERMANVHVRDARFGGLDDVHLDRVTASLDRLNTRLDHIDDRIGFVERLVETRPATRQRLSG